MVTDRKPVVVVGSINMDLVTNAKHIPVGGETILGTGFATHPGGKGANQAVAVARLGYPVQLIGRLGEDAFGGALRSGLMESGVGVEGVAQTRGSSGVAVITVAENGENSIVVTPGANGLLRPEDLDRNLELLRSAGMVLAQLEVPLETVEHLAGICAREGVPLMLDPAPARELPNEMFRQVTWFTPNETEASFYAGREARSEPADVAQGLLGRGVQGVVLKLGGRGAYVATGRGGGELVPSSRVDAVDTTAAGDCFNGAFAAAVMMGRDPIGSARFAAAAAAISVTRVGAQASMPTMHEVEELFLR